MGMALARVAVIAASALAGLAAGPALGAPSARWWLAAAGAGAGLLIVLLERRARAIPLDRLVWGAAGGAGGLAIGLGLGAAVDALAPAIGGIARGWLGLAAAYLGLAIALAQREALAGLSARLFGEPAARAGEGERLAILDTSAIIDGRIAEVCAAGFLAGPLVVPQFVLRELQQIADSPDAIRRNRGKRGFEVLRRLQALPGAPVRLDDRDVPGAREVDRKLVELAKLLGARLVTNDYNLGELAELSGVTALNLNELAGALRPVALPGETLRVHVVREGKEAGQGVAYLDDGTMVVVDQGRRLIGHAVDAAVTSVLQTPAGRMIFARPLASGPPPVEPSQGAAGSPAPAAPAAATARPDTPAPPAAPGASQVPGAPAAPAPPVAERVRR